MLALRKSFTHPVHRLQSEMDTLFNDLFHLNGFGAMTRTLTNTTTAFPPVNVWEDENNLYVEAELPGFSMNDVNVEMEGDELTIHATREETIAEGTTVRRRERRYGEFTRTLRLTTPIDTDRVEAALDRGVLTVTLPKAEQARARKIVVKSR